jgi:hypothetical protein
VPSEDILDLLGRYATGSLTDAERQRLFDAALNDQDLFEELAREQELKMLLEEPGARDRMMRALDAPPRRATWILSGAVAAGLAVLLITFLMHPRPKPQQIAIATQSPPSVAVTEPETAPPLAPVREPVKERAAAPSAKKSEPPVGQPVIGQPNKDLAENQVQVQAAAPAIAPAAQQQNAPGGPRQMAQQRRAALLDQKTSTFSFHYSAETKGHLIIVPGADGYLFVTSGDGAVLFSRKQIAAAITTDINVPGQTKSAVITFSPDPSPVTTSPVQHPEPSGNIEGTTSLAIEVKMK